MANKQLSSSEVAEIGERLYRDRIQEVVEPDQLGRFLVMDIDSGDYEVDDRDIHASLRLRERRPQGILYGIRIGHSAAYQIGGPLTVAKP